VLLRRRRLLSVLALTVLWGCEPKPTPEEEAGRAKLIGRWLEEVDDAVKAKQSLVILNADGKFLEKSRFVDESGTVTREEHGGLWFFHGRNFKRMYKEVGASKLPPSHFEYGTYELVKHEADELVGVNHVAKKQTKLRRVGADFEL
jgi:hypothetical protein